MYKCCDDFLSVWKAKPVEVVLCSDTVSARGQAGPIAPNSYLQASNAGLES